MSYDVTLQLLWLMSPSIRVCYAVDYAELSFLVAITVAIIRTHMSRKKHYIVDGFRL